MARVTMTALAVLTLACGRDTPESSSADASADGMAGMTGMALEQDAPIRVTARQAALAGVRYAVAREGPLTRSVRAVAMAVPDERALGQINARVSGWVEELYADQTGQLVAAGDPLFALYAPDLVAAQEELLLTRRLPVTPSADSLRAAARRRLAQWGIADNDIARIEETGVVQQRLVVRSPYSGHILEKHVIAGQMIRPGDPLYQIADLSTIWIEPAIFEADIALVRIGQRATVTMDALPGATFDGRVTFIHPRLDGSTRTLRVRVEIPNRPLRIRPGMFGTVRIIAEGPRGVTVPLTAILPTGTRDLAFVVRAGAVVPTEVVVGARGDSMILVVDGLAPGDTVVAAAAFLFDSESQLAAAMAGIMLNMGMGLEMRGMQMEEGPEGRKVDTLRGQR